MGASAGKIPAAEDRTLAVIDDLVSLKAAIETAKSSADIVGLSTRCAGKTDRRLRQLNGFLYVLKRFGSSQYSVRQFCSSRILFSLLTKSAS
eukprot:1184965-Prorocentrum_minimum.AAC.4